METDAPVKTTSRPVIILTICVVLYMGIFFFFSSRRALSSSYGDADLGIYGQAFYTTLSCGEFFYNTYEGGSHFRMHSSPVFFLILPFYALHPGLYTLLFLMTCALAAGAYPVFLIARERLSDFGGLVFGILYLMYHPLHGVNFDQFHQLAFAVTPLLFSYYFFLKRRFALFWLCCLIVLSCREEIAITMAAYGLYLVYYSLVQHKKTLARAEKRTIALNGLALVLCSTLYLFISLYLVIPAFRGHEYAYVGERYGGLGSSLFQVAGSLLCRPWLVFTYFWNDVARVHYVVELLLPLAFLSLWEMPVVTIAVPQLLINVLSSYSTMYLTGSRYPSVIIPFIFISAILGAEKLARRNVAPELQGQKFRRIMLYPLVLTLLSMFLINPSPLRIYVERSFPWLAFRYPKVSEHQRKILTLAEQFPRSSSIATQSGIYHHLCCRKGVYCGFHQGVDYIFVDSSSRWYAEHSHWNRDLPAILERGDYEPLFRDDYILILGRKDLREPVHFHIP